MNTIRYLTFEINRVCPNIKMHTDRCPIGHPERYKFSTSNIIISDSIILDFWRWCRTKGFRGIILWHMYNEPILVLPRIRVLKQQIKIEFLNQRQEKLSHKKLELKYPQHKKVGLN